MQRHKFMMRAKKGVEEEYCKRRHSVSRVAAAFIRFGISSQGIFMHQRTLFFSAAPINAIMKRLEKEAPTSEAGVYGAIME